MGLQHLYLGKLKEGIISFIFSWTGIPSIIGIVNCVQFLTQSDDDFKQKFENNPKAPVWSYVVVLFSPILIFTFFSLIFGLLFVGAAAVAVNDLDNAANHNLEAAAVKTSLDAVKNLAASPITLESFKFGEPSADKHKITVEVTNLTDRDVSFCAAKIIFKKGGAFAGSAVGMIDLNKGETKFVDFVVMKIPDHDSYNYQLETCM